MSIAPCNRRAGRRRRPLTAYSLIVSSLLAGPYNVATAAAPILLLPVDGNAVVGGVVMEKRGRGNLRHRQPSEQIRPQSEKRRRLSSGYTNVCKGSSPTLLPGETLQRGEFLCHGNMRFGIDADSGQFIVGFVNSTTNNTNNVTDTSNVTTAGGGTNGGSTADGMTVNSATDATPTTLAWKAIPTTLAWLFMPAAQTSFSHLTLTSDGNILGYDASNLEIYDSNYDYHNRIRSKEENSVLGFSNDCRNAAGMMEEQSQLMENGGGGDGSVMCVTLTSPPRAGMPLGMITWGVKVRPSDMVAMEHVPETPAPTPTPAPVLVESLIADTPQSTSRPTQRRTRRPSAPGNNNSGGSSSAAANSSPTPSPSDNNIFTGESQSDFYGSTTTSNIYGTVWLDTNRDGRIDQGESTIKDFEVKLYECSVDTSRSEHPNGQVQSAVTDVDGYYFFEVPPGGTYRVKFDVSAQTEYGYSYTNEYGYSVGPDSDTNMLGWTNCHTSNDENHIQWNAGLYLVGNDEYQNSSFMPESAALAPAGVTPAGDANKSEIMSPTKPPAAIELIMARIGGFIYLDVDENGNMENNERTAAVGGYTVNDAMIVVSLTDCYTEAIIESLEVSFPGTYSFGNLTEGLYKLGYEMQVIARANNGASVPLYSFVDGSEQNPTVYETVCGKLGKGEIIDSGNVGMRSKPLVITSYAAGGQVGPQSLSDEIGATNSTEKNKGNLRTAAVDTEDPNEKEGNGSFVPALMGALVVLSIVVVAGLMFVKRRNGDLSTFPFLGSSKAAQEDVRSVGSSSSIEGDMSMVSASDSKAQQTAIGSLVVETGKSVAALTTIKGDDAYGSSDEESDSPSYTGMEFALKQQSTPTNCGSPYQSSPCSDNNSNTEQVEEEDGSEGYEVYDDVDDEDQQGNDAAVYGPVVADMIAKYSQKQGQSNDEIRSTGSGRSGGSQGSQGEQRDVVTYQQAQDQGQNHSEHQDHDHENNQGSMYTQEQQESHDYHVAAAAYQLQYQQNKQADQSQNRGQQKQESYQQYQSQQAAAQYTQYQDYQQHQHPNQAPQYQGGEYAASSGDEHPTIVPSDQDNTQHHHQCETDYNQQGYYSNNNATYDQAYQYNNASDYGDQHDETSISGSSRSSDPPAASYRDIPAANAGRQGGVGGVGHPKVMTDDFRQYETSNDQYAADDGVAYAGNYDSSQYNMASSGDNGGIEYAAANYESIAGNDQGADGAYPVANYDNYEEQHPPIDSDSSSSSSSSEEASNSGWSSSSSTSGGNSLFSNWSHGSSSGGASAAASSSHKSRARRAQSNPRDDRRSAWAAAIPENSTVEYNAYMSNNNQSNNDEDDGGYSNGKEGGVVPTPPQSDDNKSVLSTDSDQSADPPGASYKNLHHRFPPPPPPPRRSPPRRISPNNNVRRASPNTSPLYIRRASPNTSPNPVATRRGRSVPPPPPRSSYPSPPPPPR